MGRTLTAMRTVTRFAVPAALATALAGGAVLIPQLASADPDLPPTTAAELLADLATADAQPFSGTVVATADLGLPELPDTGEGQSELMSLVAGSTTVRLWYGGPDQARAAVLGTFAETDVIRDGTDLWAWRSEPNTALHVTLPEHTEGQHSEDDEGPVVPGAASPADAAEAALAAIDPSTAVSLDGTASVAGRDAYELVLEPRDTESLVGEVRLAVDAVTSFPLRVQVISRGASEPAYENGFESITFGEPPADVFTFPPPPGAEVTEMDARAMAAEGGMGQHALPEGARPSPGDMAEMPGAKPGQTPTVVGEDWTSVLVLRGVDASTVMDSTEGGGAASALLDAFQPVSGEYGTGQAFSSSLLSVLMLDDGRTLVGSVPVPVLERAALDPAAAVDAPTPTPAP